MQRLFLLVLVLAAGVWAPCVLPGADLTFSHRLHLTKAGATCADCHASAASSTSAADRNLPSEKHCLACHDGTKAARIDTSGLATLQTAERTYRFNHEFHLKLGNIQPMLAKVIDDGEYMGKPGDIRRHLNTSNPCHGCHRGLEETDLATQQHLPRMGDCLICHTEIDNPFSCEKCHLEGVNLRPADHTPEFIDLHATGKLNYDKATCLPCHGRNFACMGCH